MNKQHKALLIFSIVFWLAIILAIILFALAFSKVPIGYYGLKADYFNPQISTQYYTPGLYNIGVGFYFILFPSSKQYLLDNKVTITNKNLQPLQVTYTLIYRIDPNQIYSMYQTMGYQYQNTLIAAANNLISTQFMNVQQESSRITLQSTIVNIIASSANKISTSIPSILVQAFFLQSIEFSNNIQNQYQQTIRFSDSYQESYEATKVEYQKTVLELASLEQQIALIKQNFMFNVETTFKQQFMKVLSSDMAMQTQRQTQLSGLFQLKRIWKYYNSSRLIFGQSL